QLLEVPSTGKPGRVNIIEGRADDEKVLHPHMLLMRHTRQVIPLSIYMKGDSAIKAYPHGRVPEGMHVDVQYLGEEVREDLLCHVIWITNEFNESKEPHDRRVVWLAEDRNYLPVHQEAYTFRLSERIPVGESSVLE